MGSTRGNFATGHSAGRRPKLRNPNDDPLRSRAPSRTLTAVEYDGWAERYDDDTQRFGWRAPEVVLEAVHAVGTASPLTLNRLAATPPTESLGHRSACERAVRRP